MNKYNENMTTLVQSIKDTFTKDEASTASNTTAGSTGTTGTTAGRVTKLTKPIKVRTWSRNMSLHTFIKQVQTWTEINDEIPEFIKFHKFMESLKTNKDIKGLPCYVGEHIL